jgi:hypothetical protein
VVDIQGKQVRLDIKPPRRESLSPGGLPEGSGGKPTGRPDDGGQVRSGDQGNGVGPFENADRPFWDHRNSGRLGHPNAPGLIGLPLRGGTPFGSTARIALHLVPSGGWLGTAFCADRSAPLQTGLQNSGGPRGSEGTATGGFFRGSELVIVNIVPGEPIRITTNLLGPVLVNAKKRLAKQVVLYHSPYATRVPTPRDEQVKIHSEANPPKRKGLTFPASGTSTTEEYSPVLC